MPAGPATRGGSCCPSWCSAAPLRSSSPDSATKRLQVDCGRNSVSSGHRRFRSYRLRLYRLRLHPRQRRHRRRTETTDRRHRTKPLRQQVPGWLQRCRASARGSVRSSSDLRPSRVPSGRSLVETSTGWCSRSSGSCSVPWRRFSGGGHSTRHPSIRRLDVGPLRESCGALRRSPCRRGCGCADGRRALLQNCSWRSVGNRITSRIEVTPASSIARRSIPIPRPPVGGIPYSSARR